MGGSIRGLSDNGKKYNKIFLKMNIWVKLNTNIHTEKCPLFYGKNHTDFFANSEIKIK